MKSLLKDEIVVKAKPTCQILMFLYWVFYLKYKMPSDYLGVIEALDTPFKVATWLYNSIEYEKDPENKWQTPIELFERRKGDCEDYMLFAGECLKEGNYFLVYKTLGGHATYLIDNDGQGYITIGTHGYVVHKYDIEKVASFFYTKWKRWKILDKERNVIKECDRRKN